MGSKLARGIKAKRRSEVKAKDVHLQFVEDAQPKADIDKRRMGFPHKAFFFYAVFILMNITQS
jgi:hypothetical protein